MKTWKHMWKSIHSKFETCTLECITHYHSDDKCQDSIEAVISDIWNLKDWLINDPSVKAPKESINNFINSNDGSAFNIQACGDLETIHKHYRADDKRRENTELIWEGNHKHPSGYPVIFKVIRRYKDNPKNTDTWEDAYELAKRAIEEWRRFLSNQHLL